MVLMVLFHCQKPVAHLIQPADEQLHIVARAAHGLRRDRCRIGIVVFLTNILAKANKLIPHRNTVACKVSVQQRWHSD
jgi:hypothetical protein